mgnify:FL=1
MKYLFTLFTLIFIQPSIAGILYIYAPPESFADYQRHLDENSCKKNSLLMNSFSNNNPMGKVLIKLDTDKGTAEVSVGLYNTEGIYHANVYQFPRSNKEAETKVSQDRFTFRIAEEGFSNYLSLNRVTLKGTFRSSDDNAPCGSSDLSYANWEKGILVTEEDFNKANQIIQSQNTLQDTMFEMLYKELKQF